MPSKRNKTPRAAHLQPQAPVQSDYDTDTANLTDNQLPLAVVPPPPPRSNAELNLLVLRRHYPETDRIVAIAPFAVLYTFMPESQTWEKCDTQGTLFVCQLAGVTPQYRVVILNRKNLENFAYDLVSRDDLELTDEYVIVQLPPAADGSPQVYGIWIFADGDSVPDTRAMIGAVIMDCARRVEEGIAGGYGQEEIEQYDDTEDQGYGFDGTTDSARAPYEAYEAPVQAELQAQMPQMFGQQIDLATLFAKPQAQGFASPPAYSGGWSGFGQQNVPQNWQGRAAYQQ